MDYLGRLTAKQLCESLMPGKEGDLKTRSDGTVIDGHHRLRLLRQRGIDIDALPREIVDYHASEQYFVGWNPTMKHFPIDIPSGGRLVILPRPRGGDWLETDIRRWRSDGIEAIISLLEPAEARDLGLEDEVGLLADNGLDAHSFPIADRNVPASNDAFLSFLNSLKVTLGPGHTTGVHCRQGIGRSGLLAVAVLMHFGRDVRSAIDEVSKARGIPVPETEAQRRWLETFADLIRASKAVSSRPDFTRQR